MADHELPQPLARVAPSFAAQGLMSTLGAELVGVSAGEVRIALLPKPALSQQHGYIHAGALTSVIDSACGYAALTVAPPGCDVLTAEFKINFMRPALADRFLAVGSVVKAGKTLTVCRGEVLGERDAGSEVIAVMQATIINIPEGR
ncbi:MAG: PaaI family thioesterase [Lysobacteraceae bacterium]